MKRKLIKQGAKKGEGSSSSDSVPSLPAKVWQPGVDKLEEGEELQCDASAYNSLHAFHIGWPCLSFDVLRDSLGLVRTDFPHTVYCVAGTQNVGTSGASGKNVKNSEIPAVTTKVSSGKLTEKVQVKRKNQQQECIQDGGLVDVQVLHQNGDPFGRKDLGKCVVTWLSQGMRAMALDFATAKMQ
ncbi:hypothetical protein FXO37_34020 [Capsicum annuum]|nr:hypothetical protein FXO37_34020 [Capsicum annuum]